MNLKLNSDWDISFTNGEIDTITGAEETGQHVKQRLQTFFGEYFADDSIGVPWLQDILGEKTAYLIVSNIIKSYILRTPKVERILEFYFDVNNRQASCQFELIALDETINQNLRVQL